MKIIYDIRYYIY